MSSGTDDAFDRALSTMTDVCDRILLQFEDPYKFPTFHERVLEPFDYYAFGQKYVSNLIDYGNSYVGGLDMADKIQEQLEAGHTVVLLANHQTEADPAVFANLLEASHPKLAQNVIYVAGDRVVTDPVAKPFSMGRNLLCVYSKKHLDDVPELKAEKQVKTLCVRCRLSVSDILSLFCSFKTGRPS